MALVTADRAQVDIGALMALFDEANTGNVTAMAQFVVAARNTLPALLDEVEDLRAKVAAVEALADELANPDATLITPIERAHRRTVSRELRDALRLKGDG